MYTLILLISLTVFGYIIGGILYSHRYDKRGRYREGRDGFGIGFLCIAICSTCALIIACGDFINLKARFQRTLYDYENTVRMVESYDGQDYGNMQPLVEAVVDINKEIARQKANVNSPWRNLWMSEEIANLKPITFPAKRVEPVQTE
jgi:hypothetical protein